MNQINSHPDSVSGAGLDFNYAVWTPGTTIQLCNVQWSNDYRDIVDFGTRKALDDFILSSAGGLTTFNKLSYVKPGNPVVIDIPFNRAMKYNYIRVSNPRQPISGDEEQAYYYFVTNCRYVAPNTTEIQVQLDVWATYFDKVKFGRCFVERGHIGIANKFQDDDNGRKYLTVPEGIDLGSEYLVGYSQTTRLKGKDKSGKETSSNVIIVSAVDLDNSGGTIDNPVLKTARGGNVKSIPSGADVVICETGTAFSNLLLALADKPWISQGILSAYMVPPIDFTHKDTLTQPISVASGVARLNSYEETSSVTVLSRWKESVMQAVPYKYRHLKKFGTFPYSFIELTMFNGQPLVIKPELLTESETDLKCGVANHIGPASPRLVVYPLRYNSVSGGTDDSGEYLDYSMTIGNFPQLPVVNNSYIAYSAANARSIAFQHQSADWSQQRALMGAATSADQANMGIANNNAQAAIGVNAANQSNQLANQTAALGALTSAAGGFLSGGLAGGAASTLMGAANLGIQVNQNNQQTAISNQTAMSRTGAQNDYQGNVRDSNLDYANFAANGDYQNAVAGINAKVQDAKLMQPTVSGQIGGDAFNYIVLNGFTVTARVKSLTSGAMSIIGDYWLRYGYAINRFIDISHISVMESFTYWKMKETYVYADIPEIFKQTIRGIFEKGVTVWKRPNSMVFANIEQNKPLEDMYYV